MDLQFFKKRIAQKTQEGKLIKVDKVGTNVLIFRRGVEPIDGELFQKLAVSVPESGNERRIAHLFYKFNQYSRALRAYNPCFQAF